MLKQKHQSTLPLRQCQPTTVAWRGARLRARSAFVDDQSWFRPCFVRARITVRSFTSLIAVMYRPTVLARRPTDRTESVTQDTQGWKMASRQSRRTDAWPQLSSGYSGNSLWLTAASGLRVNDVGLSDHHLLEWSVDVTQPTPAVVSVTCHLGICSTSMCFKAQEALFAWLRPVYVSLTAGPITPLICSPNCMTVKSRASSTVLFRRERSPSGDVHQTPGLTGIVAS